MLACRSRWVDKREYEPFCRPLIVVSLKDLLAEIYPDVANVKETPMDCMCERAILTPNKKTH